MKIYIGFTSNLEQRLLSHNELGKKGFTLKGSVQESVAHLDNHIDYQYINLGVPHFSEHSPLKYRPWEVIHTETFETKKEAMQREKSLKTAAGRRFIWDKIEQF